MEGVGAGNAGAHGQHDQDAASFGAQAQLLMARHDMDVSPLSPDCSNGGGGCMVIRGLSWDATQREVYILFSSCPGFVGCHLHAAASSTVAVVRFDSEEDAIRAAESRSGTVWGEGSKSVEIEAGTVELASEWDTSELVDDSDFSPSPLIGKLSLGASSKGSPSKDVFQSPKTGGSGKRVRISGCVLRRLEAAIERRKIPLLEKAIAEVHAEMACGHELAEHDQDVLQRAEEIVTLQHRRARCRKCTELDTRVRARMQMVSKFLLAHSPRPHLKVEVLDAAAAQAEGAISACLELGMSDTARRIEACLEKTKSSWLEACRKRLREVTEALSSEDPGVWNCYKSELQHSLMEAQASGVFNVPGDELEAALHETNAFLQETPMSKAMSTSAKELELSSRRTEEDNGLAIEAMKMFDNIKDRNAAAQSLESAMEGGRIKDLRIALRRAVITRVDAAQVKAVQAKLEWLEGRAKARWMIMVTVATVKLNGIDICEHISSMKKLVFAVAEASKLGLTDNELSAHRRLMMQISIHHDMEQAINKLDFASMRRLAQRAKEEGLQDLPGDKVQRLLESEDKRVAARQRLMKTMQIKRRTIALQALPLAVKYAQDAGVAEDELYQPRRRISAIAASKYLEAAIQGERRKSVIQSTLEKAMRSNVDQDVIVAGNKALHEEDLITKMDESVASGDVEMLTALTQEWKDAELDPLVYQDAERMLQELRDQALRAKRELELVLRKPITFRSDSVELDEAGLAVLAGVVEVLKASPSVAIEIHGHSMHNIRESSVQLALRRAEVVKGSLLQSGCKNPMRTRAWQAHPSVRRRCVRIFPRWAHWVADPVLEDAANPDSQTLEIMDYMTKDISRSRSKRAGSDMRATLSGATPTPSMKTVSISIGSSDHCTPPGFKATFRGKSLGSCW